MLYKGDCLQEMKQIPDGSVDTIITDPPYGLSFMGKKWDYDVPAVEVWEEALRVLKPGGTMLCFAGSRTQHRMAVNVEDAGFILKDCIMWLYGSGFPKATDISKQLDKTGGKATGWFGKWLKTWRTENNIPQKEIAKLFPSKTGGLTGCVANWELGLNMPTAEQFTMICKQFSLPFTSIEEAEREIVTKQKSDLYGEFSEEQRNNFGASSIYGSEIYNNREDNKILDETIPATPEAKLWNGWKSHGLKPAYEPILVAMKPNEGTYANNALVHGVSGLNIDGARIGTEEIHLTGGGGGKGTGWGKKEAINETRTGRYPANIILDEEAGRMLDEQAPSTGAFAKVKSGHSGKSKGIYYDYAQKGDDGLTFYGDGLQGASRFFYCAKASKKERNAGCDGLEEKRGSDDYRPGDDGSSGIQSRLHGATKKGTNHHPTVKPLALMEYLCTLTKTPTGGIVLDPYAGSGTTGVACVKTGREFIGIEQDEEYYEIAKKRIKEAKDACGLFK